MVIRKEEVRRALGSGLDLGHFQLKRADWND